MNKLLARWVVVIFSFALLIGCTSGGTGSEETDDSNLAGEENDTSLLPLPSGLPVFAEINEPYLNASSNGDGLSLFSYKTKESASGISTETEIFTASADLIVSLNTVDDAEELGQPEYTLLSKNDSVYLVNHLSNEIRLLSHFVNKVCELIPTEIVSEKLIKMDTERQLTVLHDEKIYVMTAEPSSSVNSNADQCLSDSKKRFYELPLDYQLDPSLQEGDIESLSLVKESRARAQLVFGWMPDPTQDPAPGPLIPVQEVMTYGYLGYAVEEQELSLFDQNAELSWTQDRELQSFEQADIAPETLSEKYIFHVQALENEQYLVQLGLDVFVVDGWVDLLSKSSDEIDSVLNDKVMSVELSVLEVKNSADIIYALPVKAFSDADDLLLIDSAKIYRLAYQDNLPTRNPVMATTIKRQNPVSFDGDEHLSNNGFSQFDLKSCESDDNDCIEAQDIDAQTWQFLTRCEAQFGCEEPSNSADLCETQEEKLQTQSNETLCTASNYRHLIELNKPENDANLIAYMQYVEDYSRHLNFMLQNNRLFITAQMDHKDLFLAYDFNQDFSSAKSLREQVFFGERASLTGMQAYFSNNNLFLTALQKGALRSNECYKDGRKVTCQLSVLTENSGDGNCTGKDLADKLCTNQFNEYESKSIFCSASQLADLSCSDGMLGQLDSLIVESSTEDAKWLPLYDYASNDHKMYLLAGDHTLALETGNLDEGKLYQPSLYTVDSTTGQKDTQLASLEGTIEQVVGGWLTKDIDLDVAQVVGRINVLALEVDQESEIRSSSQSTLATYLLEKTFENDSSNAPEVIKAPKVAERLFDIL